MIQEQHNKTARPLIDMETLERVTPIIRNVAHPLRLRILDYLDHAGLCAFLAMEQQQRDTFLEEVAGITADQATRHATRRA